MEQQCCGKTQVTIYPQKVQNLDQYLMKPGQTQNLLAGHRTFFKV